MKRTQLYLEDRQHEEATRVAAEAGLTLSDIVRTALDEHLDRRRKQRKEFVTALQNASGIWKQRTDIPPLAPARKNQERMTWPSEP